jgi:hypothetical protein
VDKNVSEEPDASIFNAEQLLCVISLVGHSLRDITRNAAFLAIKLELCLQKHLKRF